MSRFMESAEQRQSGRGMDGALLFLSFREPSRPPLAFRYQHACGGLTEGIGKREAYPPPRGLPQPALQKI